MNVHSYVGRAGAAAAAAALLVCTSFTPAEAAVTARATSVSRAAGSGTWGAAATTDPAAPPGSPLTLAFTNNGNPAHPSFTPQYFTVRNTGTLAITSGTYTLTPAAPDTVGFVVESCSGTWNETADTCTGTITTTLTAPSGSTPTTTTSPTIPTASGTTIRLRATVNANGNIPNNTTQTLTIAVTVNRTQVRTATTTGG
ncbi:hypothetical protein [Pseudarthrobacter sp. H2]|uniref:hypothetical protein n=1 Tax=Pseudarthrobacter sp. H2 TaxID=3418415 RepID=UPI003CF46BD0